MSAFGAFLRKEWKEQVRSGRLLFLLILFLLLGIMNPAIAKLTPWLLEIMSDSMAESGMVITGVEVNAAVSWTQFFKNIPMGLLAFLLIEYRIFTWELESGTLVLALTKSPSRYSMVLAKTGILTVFWCGGFWLCFAVTWGYNAYFWENTEVSNLTVAALCWWLFGLWCVMLTVFFSAVGRSGSSVLLGIGAAVLAVYLAGLFPQIKEYVPSRLMESAPLLAGTANGEDYIPATVITALLSGGCVAVSIPVWNRKSL